MKAHSIPVGSSKSLPDQYAKLYQEFRWHVPEHFNIAEVCCRRWQGEAQRCAIISATADGRHTRTSYAQLATRANQLSNLLQQQGVQRGDVVACLLPQRVETAVSIMACLQMGVIVLPLSCLFGRDALEYRLQHSQARVLILDHSGVDTYRQIAATCPDLQTVIAIDCPQLDTTLAWDSDLADMPAHFDVVNTRASDPAILIYTSGTTGPAKGALIPHAAMLGNLSGFVASQNWFPQDADVFWSPADWAWTGGLMDALLPTLYFGQPIVAWSGRFSAETAFELMEKYHVTNTFRFPTALKMMMKACPQPRQHYRLKLRAIMSAGEAVGSAVFEWCQQALGVTPNEMFGQTEMNYIVGNSHQRWPAKAGSMGRPYPGHRVAIIDDAGQPVGPGVCGEVALHRRDIHGHPDPIFFLGYWQNDAATRSKYSGDWCRTGDLASCDEDGYLFYQGRADDMFKAAGYRIGPSEIENCLLHHAAVANAAVVPKPDRERGNLVKAYIVLSPGFVGDTDLIATLQQHVRSHLAPYEYPKEIEFIAALPMTATGKIQRSVLRLQEQQRAAASGHVQGRINN